MGEGRKTDRRGQAPLPDLFAFDKLDEPAGRVFKIESLLEERRVLCQSDQLWEKEGRLIGGGKPLFLTCSLLTSLINQREEYLRSDLLEERRVLCQSDQLWEKEGRLIGGGKPLFLTCSLVTSLMNQREEYLRSRAC